MAIPPWHIEEVRNKCRFHAQVEVESVAILQPPPAKKRWGETFEYYQGGLYARVAARVVRVFRGHKALRIGDPLEFDVSVAREVRNIPGMYEMVYDVLRAARYLEVFVSGKPPRCGNVGFLLPVIIAEPSEEPVVKPDPNAGRSPLTPRWWEFWKK